MTDINEIKAGEYQLIAERWDERTSKPGEPFTFNRHRRGDRFQLSEADARRLVLAGAAVVPGTLERNAAEAARRQYLALLNQMPEDLRRELRAQDAAAAVLDLDEPGDFTDLVDLGAGAGDTGGNGDEELARLRAELEAARSELAARPPAGQPTGTSTGSQPVELKKPASVANKETWVDYRKAQASAGGASPEVLAKLEDSQVAKAQLQDDEFVARLLAS